MNNALKPYLLLCGFVSLALPSLAHAQRAIVMLRHAERAEYDHGDGVLSQAGMARAKALANLLKDVGVTAIYISNMKRTRLTAAPLAEALNLTPIAVSGADAEYVAAMTRRLQQHDDDDVVLIIGHVNTFLPLLRALGHSREEKIGDFEHDDVFVVVPKGSASPTVLRLNY